eukprot:2115332-Rhodomonas_salina.1
METVQGPTGVQSVQAYPVATQPAQQTQQATPQQAGWGNKGATPQPERSVCDVRLEAQRGIGANAPKTEQDKYAASRAAFAAQKTRAAAELRAAEQPGVVREGEEGD